MSGMASIGGHPNGNSRRTFESGATRAASPLTYVATDHILVAHDLRGQNVDMSTAPLHLRTAERVMANESSEH